YDCTIDIRKAKPQFYEVKLDVALSGGRPPTNRKSTAAFKLPIGAKGESILKISKLTDEPIVVTAGGTGSVQLLVQNNFPQYDVTLTDIQLNDSAGLVVPITPTVGKQTLKNEVILHGDSDTLTVNFQTKGVAPGLILQTLDNPKLYLTVFYTDGFRPERKTIPPFTTEFQLSFNLLYLLIAVLFGGGLGLLIKQSIPPDNPSVNERGGSLFTRFGAPLVVAVVVVIIAQ